jgi:alkylation response protein AidB-like acyl-CoA dehydrogenase
MIDRNDGFMTGFVAPLAHLRFTLDEIVGANRLYGSPAFPEVSAELADAVLDEAGKFAGGVLAPLNRAGDKQGARLDQGKVVLSPGFKDAYGQFVQGGWNAVTGDPKFGGQGLPHVLGIALMELWQSANMSFALCPMLTQGAIEAIGAHGTAEQKAMYLPKLISGEWTGTMNLTEPSAGSDVGALKTKAERASDGTYRITGQKIYITWGQHDAAENIVHLVLARLPGAPFGTRGISLFIVPKFLVNPDGSLGAANDVNCVGVEHKLGIHGSPTCTMAYGEKGGAIGYLIGAENKGIAAMFTMMNAARLNVGLQGVAVAERAFQKAYAYARDRHQGKPYGLSHEMPDMIPIIQHADVRRMLLTMRVQVEAGRAICLANALAMDEARHAATPELREAAKGREEVLTPLSKAWCTDMGVEVASLGVQVHGGMGFVEETGAAQYYRDARILPIYEGTNGIQAIDLVGRKLGLQNGEAFRRLMAEISRTAQDLESAGVLKPAVAQTLSATHASVGRAADWMAATMKKEPNRGLAGATPFLRAMGLLTGAHFLCLGALAAARKLEAGVGPERFYKARMQSAEFFVTNLLPQAVACANMAINGGDAIVGASPDEIGA